ncbi:hypothetical protein D3C86_2075140 [compost metagenome]
MATKAINGAAKAMVGLLKWLARYDRIDRFCAFASASCAGDRVSTQLKTKNSTITTIKAWARDRICELRCSACSP